MKTVRIQAFQIGLVFKHGGYQKMLSAGNHWLWSNETVHIYNHGDLLQNLPCDLSVLLAHPEVAAALDVVEVKDNEIALQYVDGLFQTILRKGRWAYWKGVKQYQYIKADMSQLEIPTEIDLISLMPQPLSAYVRTYTVEAHERSLAFLRSWTTPVTTTAKICEIWLAAPKP